MEEYAPTPDDLRNLREWIGAIPYLPHHLEDQELETYFRSFKGSLEKTKMFIDKFYQGRLKYPEILTNLNPHCESAKIDQELAYKIPLPKKLKDGSLVIATKVRDSDVEFEPNEVFRMYAIMFRILVLEGQLKSGKVVFIADCKNAKLSHVKKMTPQIIMTVLGVLQTIFPYRITGMHAIGLPSSAMWMVNLLKSILSPKLADRLFLHETPEELLKWIPKEVLPSDLGGEEESFEILHDKYKKKLSDYASRIVEEEKELKKLDLLRQRNAQNEIFVGSFRKLEID